MSSCLLDLEFIERRGCICFISIHSFWNLIGVRSKIVKEHFDGFFSLNFLPVSNLHKPNHILSPFPFHSFWQGNHFNFIDLLYDKFMLLNYCYNFNDTISPYIYYDIFHAS